jgi:nucleotide-binding universal stress UspA family protein
MKYLIPFDFSQVSKNAVDCALKMPCLQEGELSLLHIVEDKEEMREQEISLKEYVNGLKTQKSLAITSHVVVGKILNDIGKIAEFHGADYIIMGTHGVDTMQKIFGSNVLKIIKNSSIPLIIFQETCKLDKISTIVMPFSIEKESIQVIKFAVNICKQYDAKLILLGRNHTDEIFKHKENTMVVMAKKYMLEHKVNHEIEIAEVSEADFPNYLEEFAKKMEADLIATTYYSESILPIFDKFVQNLVVNKYNIPVLCVNSKSLSSSSSILSVMTN